MPESPQHEVKGDAMPQPDQHHRTHLCNQNNQQALLTKLRCHQGAAQRRKEIGAKPACQRDMPAIPKGGDIWLEIGRVEVFWQLDTRQDADSDGNVAVTGKVKKYLKTVSV